MDLVKKWEKLLENVPEDEKYIQAQVFENTQKVFENIEIKDSQNFSQEAAKLGITPWEYILRCEMDRLCLEAIPGVIEIKEIKKENENE